MQDIDQRDKGAVHLRHRAQFDLSGRRALVTGAGRGLGWEIARALAEAGAHVCINGRDGARLEARTSELNDGGLSGEAALFDVSDRKAVDRWVAGRSEPVDILVNNVGVRHRKQMVDCSTDEFEDMLRVNLTAAYHLARQMAPAMIAARQGAIVNVTSIAGPLGHTTDVAYTAAKGGLAGLTRSLATELGPHGVRCNGIAPGFFATEANHEMLQNPETNRYVDMRVPLKRWGKPAEIAGAAVFLASPAASYINGHILTVDGGLSGSF